MANTRRGRKRLGKTKAREYQRTYYANNRAKRLASAKKWREANPDYIRDRRKIARIRHKYGLTADRYREMLVAQEGRCAICRELPAFSANFTLAVDHDHATGKVRALLCTRCNNILGKAADQISVLQRAIKYLRRHGAR